MKILLIEDDVKLASLLQRGLAGAGHAVDAEYDGETGEDAAARGAYEVIVLDVMLPKKNGLDVLRNAAQAGPHITGDHADRARRNAGRRRGIQRRRR